MANTYLKQLIKKNKKNFSKSENLLADYFMNIGEDLINKTISEISLESEISQTTVFNFVKKLGFSGFQNFKIELATNTSNKYQNGPLTAYSDITAHDSPMEIAHKIISFNIQSLKNLVNNLEENDIKNAVSLVNSSSALHFFGQGGSSVVAFDAYHKFLRSTYNCSYNPDYHIQLSYATKLNKGDCAFLFSHNGETIETINIARTLKNRDCSVICLTGNPSSPLLEYVDQAFIITSDESKFRTESLTSRILYLTVIDIIYTLIMYLNEDENYSNIENIRHTLEVTKFL
ncbi:MurR/RpiR family transcriptional regulator [Ignavigranum ruoffiae]|uniref:MurR/RpiR family transcriptional regulator n=1 Tax=Ignavigranum ruoffiae TaxID=89093 RepID=UPI0020482B2B|nr:MurR/RpiR family transcriptional regulator [Ignavigranum ruoffiae]UPQ86606.1 MurR/RpiR family transcriptional regulator [Ignavigranum ruoffiae]